MITFCTVVPETYEPYCKIMLDSVFKHFKYISKIYIARPNPNTKQESVISTETKNNIQITKFETPVRSMDFGHALGLHACINKVDTEYIMLSDPDVFYCSAVDELYISLIKKYTLQYVGCSHHSSTANAYGFFPYLMSTLIKKDDLPPLDWMKGYLKYRDGIIMREGMTNDNHEFANGKYLLPGPIPKFCEKLPNIKERVFFDTGNSLCLYSIEKNWQWLSFQTVDCHFYTTKFYKTSPNLRIRGQFTQQDILWHSVRSGAENLEREYKNYDLSRNSNA